MNAPLLSVEELRRLLPRLQAGLAPNDHARLVHLVGLLEGDARVAVRAALDVVSPGTTDEAANTALRRFTERIAHAAGEAGLKLGASIAGPKSAGPAGRRLGFAGRAPLELHQEAPELSRTQVMMDVRGRPDGPRIPLERGPNGKPVVRWYLVFTASDDTKARELYKGLDEQLRSFGGYQFEGCYERDILAGEDRAAWLRARIARAHLRVVAVSPALLGDRGEGQAELGYALDEPGGRVVPVALQPIDDEHADLGGLQGRHRWTDQKQRAYVPVKDKHAWVAGLAAHLLKLVKEYGEAPPEAPGAAQDTLPDRCDPDLLPHQRKLGDLERVRAMLDPRGSRVSLAAGARVAAAQGEAAAAGPSAEAEGVEAVGAVLEWVREPGAPELFALLGEVGTGKTITCQRVVRALEQREHAGDPTPVYVDLRSLTRLRDRALPTLEQVLDECLARNVVPGGPRPPTAQELLERARLQPFLFVFDGLDEVLVHLAESDGQAFTRELLRLRGPLARGELQGRILLSCRTHYFRTIEAERAHFTGHDRGAVRAPDYRGLVLLPLTEDQIRAYLAEAVPDLDVGAAFALIESVHDLKDLSRRPYTLALVAEHLPEVQARRAAGRPVYGVTLYRAMVDRWLSRDDGKHQVDAADKPRLLTHLAAWLWGQGARVLPARKIEDWLHAWLESQPDLRRRYRELHHQKLEEDLRTATFLVRQDGEGGSGFRFAHASLLEFFLARGLFEAIEEDRPAAWALPALSVEALDFLGQHLAEAGRRAHLDRLGDWCRVRRAPVNERILDYALRAARRGWPTPALDGGAFAEADLQGRNLEGPFDLRGSCWRDANLRETRWAGARLDGADLAGADLRRAVWDGVHALGADLAGAALDGATFRRCAVDDGPAPPPGLWRTDSVPTPASSYHVLPQAGHGGTVWACAFSPDGVRALSASGDNTLRLWDTRTGRALATWEGHTNGVTACAFSPDGLRALSASQDKTLRLWDTRTGRRLATWEAHTDSVTACAFSPDGLRALSASRDNTLRLWDTRTGRALATGAGHTNWVSACAFSPDGLRALSASHDKTLRLWDTRTGKALATWEGHTNWVSACAFSPDGLRALSASWDKTLRLWDTRTGRALATWEGHTYPVTACAFSPDGLRALSASGDKTLRLWDTRTGRALATWKGHTNWVSACAFSPDGLRALSASDDRTLRLWDTRTGRALATWEGHTQPVTACAFSPDGLRALSASDDNTLRLWDTRTGRALATWEGHTHGVTACAFSPDGLRALSASLENTLRLWDTRTGRALATWEGHTDGVTACAFSPDGLRALSASWDNTLRLWDTRTGRALATWEGHTDTVTACAFSPDGLRALSAGNDNTLRLWDTRTGRALATWEGHTNWVTACAFSPDGLRALSASRDKTLQVSDVATGTPLQVYHLLPERAWAVWRPTPGEVHDASFLGASPNAWRWLSWQARDAGGNVIDVLPAEAFGALPGAG